MTVQIPQVFARQEADGRALLHSQTFSELTTHEAADLIYVSERYMVRLLDSNAIPSQTVGTRRRVLVEHVMAYKKAEDNKRIAVLSELARQAQELSLGY